MDRRTGSPPSGRRRLRITSDRCTKLARRRRLLLLARKSFTAAHADRYDPPPDWKPGCAMSGQSTCALLFADRSKPSPTGSRSSTSDRNRCAGPKLRRELGRHRHVGRRKNQRQAAQEGGVALVDTAPMVTDNAGHHGRSLASIHFSAGWSRCGSHILVTARSAWSKSGTERLIERGCGTGFDTIDCMGTHQMSTLLLMMCSRIHRSHPSGARRAVVYRMSPTR
jgi:hypothetical protein